MSRIVFSRNVSREQHVPSRSFDYTNLDEDIKPKVQRRVDRILFSFSAEDRRDSVAIRRMQKSWWTNGGGRPPPLSSQSQLNTILRELRALVMAQKESKLKSPSWQNDRWCRPDTAKTRTREREREGEGRGGRPTRETGTETWKRVNLFLPWNPVRKLASLCFERMSRGDDERKYKSQAADDGIALWDRFLSGQ